MKRASLGMLACALLLAQSPRDAYRSAYAAWRQTDPNLERDAASPQRGFTDRVERVGDAAAVYGKARAEFLRASAHQDLGPLAQPFTPELELLAKTDLRAYVNNEGKGVDADIRRFQNDKDKGIIQWRQALERERAALTDLGKAIDDREAATVKAAPPLAAVEGTRMEGVSQYSQYNGAIAQAADIMDKEAAAWGEYYRTLAKASPPPVVVAPKPVVPQKAPEEAPSIPLIRYTGTWSFPPSGGIFSGSAPEFVDLAVHNEGGILKGSFYARFTVPDKTDPIVRFDFSGPVTQARTQSLTLVTTDGAKGTVDLIPGSAFNLLEINFHTEQKPGKLSQGDMVLLKKVVQPRRSLASV